MVIKDFSMTWRVLCSAYTWSETNFCWLKFPSIEPSTLHFSPKLTFGGCMFFSSCHIVGWSRSDPNLWGKLEQAGSTRWHRWAGKAAPTLTALWFKASVLCDLLLLHFLQGRDYYKQKKFKYAEQEPVSNSKSLPCRGSCGYVSVHICMTNDAVTQTTLVLRSNQAPSWASGNPEPLGLSETGIHESPLQNYRSSVWLTDNSFIPSFIPRYSNIW